MKMLFLPFVLVSVLSGCATTTYVRTPHFNMQDHLQYTTDGQAALRGESGYRNSEGEILSCAHQTIYLLPDTQFFEHLMAIDNSGYFLRKKIAPQAQSLVRFTQCDEHGRFVFERLPEAKWIAVSPLREGGIKPLPRHSIKSPTIVLVKPLRSLDKRTDEVFLLESDSVYEVPSVAVDRLIVQPDPNPVVVKGGECVAQNLGKEENLPHFCVEKETIPLEKNELKNNPNFKFVGEK